MIQKAIEIVEKASILVIIGTSMQVYPAAGLVNYVNPNTPTYFIDPKPNVNKNNFSNLTVIKDIASTGTDKLIEQLVG